MTMSTAAEENVPPAAAPAADAKAQKSKKTLTTLATVGLVAALGGGLYYAVNRGLETTDDAQIDADIVSIPTRTASTVVAVHFTENQTVKKGALLVELDDAPAKARLAQAQANLEVTRANAEAAEADEQVITTNAVGNKTVAQAQVQGAVSTASATKPQIAEAQALVDSAQANFERARIDLERAKTLLSNGSISQAEMDRAQTTFDVASASLTQSRSRLLAMRASTDQANSQVQVASAKLKQAADVDMLVRQAHAKALSARAQMATAEAARDLAALDLSYTKISAPSDGVVSKKTVAIGQMLSPGQGVAQLVPNDGEWVTGNFKETQLTKMHTGQPAEVEIDAFPGKKLHGEVESFSAATGARFSLLPPDNATGNFTKVVQRVPVRIRLHDAPADLGIRPGMSVVLTVNTRR